jgi:hypothetical protein
MTYGLKVRSPVNMQTEWREDYSHREAKIFGSDRLKAGVIPCTLRLAHQEWTPTSRYVIEAIASTIHYQRPSRKTD